METEQIKTFTHDELLELVNYLRKGLALKSKNHELYMGITEQQVLRYCQLNLIRFMNGLKPGAVPQHIDYSEATVILTMRRMNFSIGDIATVCDRSKATIHDFLKKAEAYKGDLNNFAMLLG